MDLYSFIRTIPDFPTPGIQFKDMTPLFGEPKAFQALIAEMAEAIQSSEAEAIVGIESRGFIMGVPIALALNLPFVPARKPGKLPAETIEVEYGLEYGSAVLQLHKDSLERGQKTAIVDDLLATGGTADAARKLIEELGAVPCGAFFASELEALQGRERLQGLEVYSLLKL